MSNGDIIFICFLLWLAGGGITLTTLTFIEKDLTSAENTVVFVLWPVLTPIALMSALRMLPRIIVKLTREVGDE